MRHSAELSFVIAHLSEFESIFKTAFLVSISGDLKGTVLFAEKTEDQKSPCNAYRRPNILQLYEYRCRYLLIRMYR
jgi:hypothetical protein